MITTLAIIGILVIAILAFTNLYPSFGGNSTKSQKVGYEQSQQFKEGKFRNVKPVPEDLAFSDKLSLAYTFFTTKVPNGRPKADLIPQKIDSTDIADYSGEARMIWFGHSSFLLQIDGKNILIDPMFGAVAAPHPLLGEKRFNKEFPIAIEQLPQIDAVILS